MAAKELYDYVDVAVADKDQTLSVSPQAVMSNSGKKNVVIHKAVDGKSETRINFSGAGNVECFIGLKYNVLDAADAGTVTEFWYDENYGDGMTNSFKFDHPDGHTYVVRFDCNFEELMYPAYRGIPVVRFKVLGKIAD